MIYLCKYATLLVTGTTAIRIPIIKRGVVDWAVGADWTPVAGDVKILIDGAAAVNVTNLPTAVVSGNTALWEFVLTAAELTGRQMQVTVSDSATKAVEDDGFSIETFGNASAKYQADISGAALPANVTQWLATAVHTPTVAGVPDVNVRTWNDLTAVALPLVPTTPGRTLDVSGTGEAGIDWANIGSPTTLQGLTGTTIAASQVVASVTGAVGSVTGGVGGNVAGSVASVVGAVGSVTTVTSIVSGILAGIVEGAITVQQSLRLSNAAQGGKASGMGTTNPKLRDLADTKDRVNATTDSSGNRSAVALDLT